MATHGVNLANERLGTSKKRDKNDGTPPHEYELVAKRHVQPTQEMTHTRELNTFKTAKASSQQQGKARKNQARKADNGTERRSEADGNSQYSGAVHQAFKSAERRRAERAAAQRQASQHATLIRKQQ